MKQLLVFLLLFQFTHSKSQNSQVKNNVLNVQFHTDDIDLFWKVFDESSTKFKGKTWQKEYLDKGSIGLKAFIPYRIVSGKKLAKNIRRKKADYEAIRATSLSIKNQKDNYYNLFRKLKVLYPKATFPDVYFVIGRGNTGGTIFNKGLIIGVERFGIATSNFTPDIAFENMDNVVAHELIHFQQHYSKNNSLLAQCIKEGAADFLGEMISGKHTNAAAHAYGDNNKQKLWEEFLSKKKSTNYRNWLYYSKNKNRPKDLGYWIGYKICESYYQQASNKTQAIADILNIQDFEAFLAKSGFMQTPKADKLSIKINKNIELLGLAYFIGFEATDIENRTVKIEGNTIPKKEWHNYGFKIYQQFKSFKNNDHLIQSFALADHLWLNYLSAFLLQLDDVPNAKLTNAIDEQYYLNFSKMENPEEAKRNAELFLSGINAFAKEIEFDKYLFESKEYYDQVLAEVENGMPDKRFIKIMESFYHKEFDKYYLIPSLTIPKGMGFGIRKIENTKIKAISIFGALDFQKFEDKEHLDMGFNPQKKLRELSIHEFGHSFVNPEVAKLSDSTFIQTAHLFAPLKSAMAEQGYTTWEACVYEHFVRAGEIIIAEKMGEKEDAQRLLKEYQEKRQFKYLSYLIIELKKYDKGEYQSYYKAVENSMESLKKLE